MIGVIPAENTDAVSHKQPTAQKIYIMFYVFIMHNVNNKTGTKNILKSLQECSLFVQSIQKCTVLSQVKSTKVLTNINRYTFATLQ